ncbi:GlxA family transcriptional regulator [Elioraea rosea]|uniref:GlxA family transcriptional regulator n=1 Tax=Elioraea rosea TaxID=2492390 RepID=UPI001950C8C3|nr:helix-turn-helix domain-containing protein [Elioraea rosea]
MPDAMGFPRRPLRVAILVLPELSSASVTYGMYDVLSGVGRRYEMLTGGTPPADGPLIDARLVSPDGGDVPVSFGVVVGGTRALSDDASAGADADLVCVPSVSARPDRPLEPPKVALDWLRARHAAGSVIATACSGAVVLAEAGLLDGGVATTHWAFAAGLRQRHPSVRVCADRVLVPSGPDERIITSSGYSSWQDLMLHLVGRFFGPERVRQMAKVHLFQWHVSGQLPFTALAGTAQHGDRAVREAQAWLAENYRAPRPVVGMAARAGLPERTFKRRFRIATGLAPLDYVHALRMEEAKQMLEMSDLPVDAVAEEVG